MSNSNISALTSASTPLAGTETLPIVQSSTTKKIATDDLTVKNIRSNATTGILQIAGPAAASTRTATVPDANWTAARTDAAQSFTGDQTLSTGNVIQGTAAKGFDFSANTPAAGKTSTLLNWYEEGTWTPDLLINGGNTGITYTSRSGRYTRNGRIVQAECYLVLSNKGARTGAVRIGGLPYVPGLTPMSVSVVTTGTWAGLTAGGSVQAYSSSAGSAVYLLLGTTTGTAALTDVNLTNTSALAFTATFSV